MALPALATSLAVGFTVPFVTPMIRNTTFIANRLLPVEIPSPDQVIHGFMNDYISEAMAIRNLRSHGIPVSGLSRELFAYASLPQGSSVLGIDAGFMDRRYTMWGAVIRDRAYFPSIDEANFLRNRKLITNELHEYIIQKQVDNNKDFANVWQEARFEIPGPSDLVRFAVREAYTPDLLQRFGYHHEVPTEVIPWMDKQGYGGTTGLQIPDGGTDGNGRARVGNATWFDLYWWSHWELPSLTQGYEMLHRLYDISEHGPSTLHRPGLEFNEPDLDMLQKAQDIPDFWRRRLQAISYHPVDKHDGQELFSNSMITENRMYHIIREHGHNANDSELLLKLAILRRQRDLGIDPGKQSLKYVCEYYKLGIISEQEVNTMISKLGFSTDDALAFTAKCKLEVKGETVKSTINTLEQAFYRGIYSEEELKLEFARNRLNEEVTRFWLARWKYNRDIKFKPASAKQNLTAYKNGVLTEANLVNRLFNLGYDGNSINIMVRNIKAVIIQAQTQALLKEQKDMARAAKAAQKAQLDAQKKKMRKDQVDAKIVTNKAQQRLHKFIKTSTDANVKAWYKAKLITLAEVFYRLFYKGYTIADAMKWVTTTFPDDPQEVRNEQAKKASIKFRSEGNYLE